MDGVEREGEVKEWRRKIRRGIGGRNKLREQNGEGCKDVGGRTVGMRMEATEWRGRRTNFLNNNLKKTTKRGLNQKKLKETTISNFRPYEGESSSHVRLTFLH